MLNETFSLFYISKEKFFVLCISLYLLNQIVLKKVLILQNSFTNNYLNDLLFIPIALPIFLKLLELSKLRDKNGNFKLLELLSYVIIWSLFAEYIGPYYLQKGVSDPIDLIMYAIGFAIYLKFY